MNLFQGRWKQAPRHPDSAQWQTKAQFHQSPAWLSSGIIEPTYKDHGWRDTYRSMGDPKVTTPPKSLTPVSMTLPHGYADSSPFNYPSTLCTIHSSTFQDCEAAEIRAESHATDWEVQGVCLESQVRSSDPLPPVRKGQLSTGSLTGSHSCSEEDGGCCAWRIVPYNSLLLSVLYIMSGSHPPSLTEIQARNGITHL